MMVVLNHLGISGDVRESALRLLGDIPDLNVASLFKAYRKMEFDIW